MCCFKELADTKLRPGWSSDTAQRSGLCTHLLVHVVASPVWRRQSAYRQLRMSPRAYANTSIHRYYASMWLGLNTRFGFTSLILVYRLLCNPRIALAPSVPVPTQSLTERLHLSRKPFKWQKSPLDNVSRIEINPRNAVTITFSFFMSTCTSASPRIERTQ